MRISATIDTSRIPPAQRRAEFFGFAIPSAFSQILDRLLTLPGLTWESKEPPPDYWRSDDRSDDDNPQWQMSLNDVLGFGLDRNDFRYGNRTPPEVFVFGSSGVGGVHFGYVIHAPELDQADYPVGYCSPTDSDTPVLRVGNSTNTAFEATMWGLVEYDEEASRDLIEAAGKALNLAPSKRRYDDRWGQGNGTPFALTIPDGWIHIPTADGVGVLAPTAAFGAQDPQPTYSQYDYLARKDEQVLAAAESAMDGAPALALVHLRELRWCSTIYDHEQDHIDGLMKLCYRRLGREALCTQLDLKMGSLPEWKN